MTSRVSSKNKEKQAKRKNSVEKKRPNRRKNKTVQIKETENRVAGSRTRFICTFKQLVDHCTTVTHVI